MAKKKIKKIVKREFQEHPALGLSCFLCSKIFSEEEIEKSKKKSKAGLPNKPVRMNQIPGWIHIRCRGKTTVGIIQGASNHENLTNLT